MAKSYVNVTVVLSRTVRNSTQLGPLAVVVFAMRGLPVRSSGEVPTGGKPKGCSTEGAGLVSLNSILE